MRKLFAASCAALMLGLCACGKADAPADQTAATTTTTTTAAESVKPALGLVEAGAFSDGVAFVRYTDDGAEKSAAINSAGEILFQLPKDMPMDARYQNGICVVGDVIYDKTGAVIASPDKSGYDALLTGNCGGYVLAKKLIRVNDGETTAAPKTTTTTTTTTTAATTTTTTIDGDATTSTLPTETTPPEPIIPTGMQLCIGVLNNKGEWEHPLDTDHPIAMAIANAAQPEEHFTPVTAGVLQVHVDAAAQPQYYHFADNKLTPNYDHYESINYQDEDTGIYKVTVDGKQELIIEDVISDYSFADAFIGRTTVKDEESEELKTLIKLYDYKGKALADLTDYPTNSKYYYITERLLITVDDGTGNRYLALLYKDGKKVIDPVPLNLRDTVFAPDEAGFVIASYTAEGAVSYRHYDYIGNATDYTNVATFNGFSEGLAAVTLTDGRLVYINHMAEIVIQ